MITNLALILGFGLLGAAIWGLRRHDLTRGLHRALTAAGVPMGPADLTGRGDFDDVVVKVSVRAMRLHTATLWITIDGPPLETDLELGPEGFITAMSQLAGWTDITIGAPRFDRDVRVHGKDPAHALKVLDPVTRRAVLRAVHLGASLDRGAWQLEWMIRGRVSTDEVRRTLDAMAAAHATVRAGLARSMREALADRVRTDPAGGVRRLALELSISRHLATPELLSHALGDVDPELRLAAALALGPQGHATLAALLRDGHRRTRLAAAAALARAPGDPAVHATVVEVAARALPDPAFGASAAEVLVAVGTPAAARALSRAAAEGHLAARRASKQLRQEMSPEVVGGLAIVEERSGALAFPEDETL